MASARPDVRQWLALGAVLVGSALLTGLASQRLGSPEGGIDDADIHLVYAKHLSLGHGFVYNAGGEAVEGFTSLLWMGIASAFYAAGIAPDFGLRALNVAMLAISVWIVLWLVGDAHRNRSFVERVALQLGLLACVALAPEQIVWTTLSGMEVALCTVLLTCAAFLILRLTPDPRSRFGFSVLLALLIVTRPEAMAWAPFLLVLALAKLWVLHGQRAARAFAGWPLATLALGFAALTGFRLLTFGYPLPNTYYAKLSPSLAQNLAEGARYLAGYVGSSVLVAISALCGVVAAALGLRLLATVLRGQGQRGARDPATAANDGVLGAIVSFGLIVPVLHGGDHFASYRFYQPVQLLLLACSFTFGARLVLSLWSARPAAAWLVSGLLVAAALTSPVRWHNVGERGVSIAHEFRIAEQQRAEGRRLAELFGSLPELPSVGVIMAGGFKRTYPGEVIDLLGLNNVAMAHSPGARTGPKNHAAFDEATFYELAPDVVAKRCGPSPYLKGIERTPRFQARYECLRVGPRGAVAGPSGVQLLVSTELAARLRSTPDVEVVTQGSRMRWGQEATPPAPARRTAR